MREQFKGPLLLPNNIQSLRNYFSQVSLIDAGVGRILDALDRMDMTRDTIVIYTADHGFSLGHNGIWGHGAAAFPASAHRHSYHIPLIIAGGAMEHGHNDHRMISQIDLFPTLASMIGSDMMPSLPSAAQDIFNPTGNSDAVFYEQEETRAIRTQEWMYSMRFKGSEKFPMSDQLFDLHNDPQEKTNLIDDPTFKSVVGNLRHRLSAHFETYSVPKYDLWTGGSAKSNVTYAPLWQDAWGDMWAPELPS